MNISIIGGDLRIIRLAEMYAKEKNKIYTYGIEKYFDNDIKNIKRKNEKEHIEDLKNGKILTNSNESDEKENNKIILCNNIKEAVEKSDIVISGMPFSKDDININAPFSQEKIKIADLKNEINNKTFIAGGIPKEFYNGKIHNFDLLQNEKLTILNAIPTVEGTIKIAIEEREETIFESNVLICGFGRIGKILCDRFKSLGANVYCAARKESDLVWIRENRYIPITYDKLPEIGEKLDLIINTVPTLIFKERELNSLKKDVLIIDVASNPGGIDKDYAQKKKIKVITALGIPGKQMPKTAAKFIKEVILDVTI